MQKTQGFKGEGKDVKPIVRKLIENHSKRRNFTKPQNTKKPERDIEDSERTKIEISQRKKSSVSKERMMPPVSTDVNGKYPYTVQVRAYKERDLAIKEVITLRNKGLGAYSTPVLLANKGKWHRIEIGVFKSGGRLSEAMRSKKKKELKYLTVIAIICFLLAVVISFITGRVPVLVDRAITKRIKGEITKKVEETKKGIAGSDIERLKKEFEKKRR
ncbi:MAG: SPOR domain-containing protein [Desulfobacterales bacterium]|nr:SPOR domain-containing protein [Desulfobacterales bacterium]